MVRKSERRKGGTRSSSGGGGDSARGGKSVAKVKASAKPTPKPAPAAPPTPKVKFHGKLLENEPLARYTTWRIGGAARHSRPPPPTPGVGAAARPGAEGG